MPLANILTPLIAKKAVELDRQITPRAAGYLKSVKLTVGPATRLDVGAASVTPAAWAGAKGGPVPSTAPLTEAERHRAQKVQPAGFGEGRLYPWVQTDAPWTEMSGKRDPNVHLDEPGAKSGGYLKTIGNKGGSGGRTVADKSVMRIAPSYGMPILQKADDFGREQNARDIAAYVERGLPAPEYLANGLRPEEIVGAYTVGAENRSNNAWITRSPNPAERALAEPIPFAPPINDKAEMSDAVYRGPVGELGVEGYLPFEARQAKGRVYDKYGFPAGVFQDKTADEAAAIIADKLQAQRERQGDPTAWWMMGPSV